GWVGAERADDGDEPDRALQGAGRRVGAYGAYSAYSASAMNSFCAAGSIAASRMRRIIKLSRRSILGFPDSKKSSTAAAVSTKIFDVSRTRIFVSVPVVTLAAKGVSPFV